MTSNVGDDQHTKQETARRRDAALKRMLETPPKPRKPKPKQQSEDKADD